MADPGFPRMCAPTLIFSNIFAKTMKEIGPTGGG